MAFGLVYVEILIAFYRDVIATVLWPAGRECKTGIWESCAVAKHHLTLFIKLKMYQMDTNNP
jgi:hypothetical protein